jgi:UDP-GlcNAc:undecaprenyl-phosphate GlcNAc-1-phosphate transferase
MLLLIAFGVATVSALLLGALVRRVAPLLAAVVPPRQDRWHDQPTPTMGGIAIALGTGLGGLCLLVWPEARVAGAGFWVAMAAAAMWVVGLLDDRVQLSPLAKLVASLIIGAFLVFALGRTELGGLQLGGTLLAIVWFAGVCHAMNLLDNMDGLATGVALIAAAGLVLIVGPELGPVLSGLLVALAGALLGFLYWNRHRARLFMGDCGSLFIGALLAGASLVPVFREGDALSGPALTVVLILIVPLFDTGFVLLLRRLAGRPATRGGTDHVSHRLVSLGFSERSAVRILYLIGLVGATMAFVMTRGSPDVALPVVALFAVTLMLLGVYLARVSAYHAQDFSALAISIYAPLIKDITFRWHAGEVLLDLVLISACYYFAYWLRFPDDQLVHFLPFFGVSLPAVLGLKLASLYTSGLYRRSWQTFGLRDLTAVIRGVGLGSLLSVLVAAYMYRMEGFSRVVFLLDAFLLTMAVVITRGSFRAMSMVVAVRSKRSRRIIVYGAGSFGQMLVREMRANQDWEMNPVAFIDDDVAKKGTWIDGVPVEGGIEALGAALERFNADEVVLSSRSISDEAERRIRSLVEGLFRRVRRLRIELE